jgi:hypothetical protein
MIQNAWKKISKYFCLHLYNIKCVKPGWICVYDTGWSVREIKCINYVLYYYTVLITHVTSCLHSHILLIWYMHEVAKIDFFSSKLYINKTEFIIFGDINMYPNHTYHSKFL